MSANDNDDDAVGYGRPPINSRFKPGQSGNPRGRRKGSINFSTDVKRTLQAPVMVQDGGKLKKVTTQRAFLMRAREKALKGDLRALALMFELARNFLVDAQAESATASSANDEAMIAHYRDRFLQEEASASNREAVPPGSPEDFK